jgi:peptide/nickel transport system substrate-binding protein
MMNHPSTDLVTMAGDPGKPLSNTEWQLADMVDAIAAEIDHAEDTLALKSYARGMSFSLRQLSLDLQVAVRRDDNGQIKFRTADPNSTGTTIIKLDFAQLLKSQLGDDRRKLEQNIDRRPLDSIGLAPEEIRALNAISIYSIDDLHRYTQTAAMIGEVSRKTNINDARLRQVLGLPYLDELKPDRGLPGSIILLEGGNFGAVQPSQSSVYFQDVALPIVAWSNARIQVQIPPSAKGNGMIFVVIDNQVSNTIDWQVLTVDLIVQDITITPSNPQENDEITLTASLLNQGTGAANAFAVQWSIDGEAQKLQPHGILPPGQASQESSLVLKTRLTAGEHKFSFTADPEQLLTDVDRANSTFSQAITITAAQNISFGDYRIIDSLDPFVSEQPWELRQSVLNLVYRGLMRLDPTNGALLNDLSQPPPRIKGDRAIEPIALIKDDRAIMPDIRIIPIRGVPPIVTYRLRQDVRFHDRTAFTPEDVVFSYKQAMASPLWAEMLSVITNIEIIDRVTVVFTLSEKLAANLNPQIWTLPILPARTYQSDPKRFINKPIGCGPFIAELKQDGKSGFVQLKAFDQYYRGKPRLQNLSIVLQSDIKGLLNRLITGELITIALPDQEGLADKLQSLQNKYQIVRTTTGKTTVLHVQSRSLLERLPNNYETNWNSHLWYI